MGKPKLRSPIKALHQALFNFRAAGSKTTTWVCIQQAKTDSFRDGCDSFQSMYYTAFASSSASSSSTSSDLCSCDNEELDQSPNTQLPPPINKPSAETLWSTSFSLSTDSDDFHPIKGSISSKRFFFSPYTTKSLSSTDDLDDSHSFKLVVKGCISSKRFFFNPCTTNSIMEEESHSVPSSETKLAEMSLQEISFSESPWLEGEEGAGGGRQCMEMQMGFCKDSVEMAMASMDPFMDFRASMEEMVVAHGLREWPSLRELLQYYLRLNDKAVHDIITHAFADLLVHLITQETKETNENDTTTTTSSSSSSSCSINEDICFSLPLCLRSKALLHH